MSVAMLKARWAAISAPWSQVREPRRCSGRVAMLVTSWSRTASAVRPAGRWTSSTYRVVRSPRVPIAEAPPAPMIRSPSQWPGTARSSISAGPVTDHDHRVAEPGRARGRVAVRFAAGAAGAQRAADLAAQPAPGLQVERLVDRLGAHPHLPVIRVILAQGVADLLR